MINNTFGLNSSKRLAIEGLSGSSATSHHNSSPDQLLNKVCLINLPNVLTSIVVTYLSRNDLRNLNITCVSEYAITRSTLVNMYRLSAQHFLNSYSIRHITVSNSIKEQLKTKKSLNHDEFWDFQKQIWGEVEKHYFIYENPEFVFQECQNLSTLGTHYGSLGSIYNAKVVNAAVRLCPKLETVIVVFTPHCNDYVIESATKDFRDALPRPISLKIKVQGEEGIIIIEKHPLMSMSFNDLLKACTSPINNFKMS